MTEKMRLERARSIAKGLLENDRDNISLRQIVADIEFILRGM
jgi:hypothetical protein